MFRFDGKSAVVTGGASGIGLACCQQLAKAGAHVHLLDLDLGAAQKAAAAIRKDGLKCSAHQCDVADEESVKRAFAAVVGESKRVDCLVNNAGIAAIGDVLKTTVAEMDRVYKVNVLGVFLCAKEAVKSMRESGWGGGGATGLDLRRGKVYGYKCGAALLPPLPSHPLPSHPLPSPPLPSPPNTDPTPRHSHRRQGRSDCQPRVHCLAHRSPRPLRVLDDQGCGPDHDLLSGN